MINPMPLQDFGDAFIIGEGRPSLLEILGRYCAAGPQTIDNRQFVQGLTDIPGVYVPSMYTIELDNHGNVVDFDSRSAPPVVESVLPLDMNSHPIYSNWTSQYACYEYDDYFSIMMALGCKKKCPFCVVGHMQGQRDGQAMNIDRDIVVDLAEDRRARYGTNLIKLFFSSAFSSGEGDINSQDLKTIHETLLQKGFQVRDGSLNVRQADSDLFDLLAASGQTEVTFAPETIERLRPGVLKSYITDDKLHYLAELASKSEMNFVAYTMGGLPGETDNTPLELANLLRSLRRTLAPERRFRGTLQSSIHQSSDAVPVLQNAAT